MNPIYKQAIDKFGMDHQLDKLIEEMGELQTAIIKHRQTLSQQTFGHLHEEFIDVQIVMSQIKTTLAKNLLWSYKSAKLARLQTLINS